MATTVPKFFNSACLVVPFASPDCPPNSLSYLAVSNFCDIAFDGLGSVKIVDTSGRNRTRSAATSGYARISLTTTDTNTQCDHGNESNAQRKNRFVLPVAEYYTGLP